MALVPVSSLMRSMLTLVALVALGSVCGVAELLPLSVFWLPEASMVTTWLAVPPAAVLTRLPAASTMVAVRV